MSSGEVSGSGSGSEGQSVCVPGCQEFAQAAVYAWRGCDAWVVPRSVEFRWEDIFAMPVRKPAARLGYDQGSGCEIPDFPLLLNVAIESAGSDVTELRDRRAKVPYSRSGGCKCFKVVEGVFAPVPLDPENGCVTESRSLELQSAPPPEGA